MSKEDKILVSRLKGDDKISFKLLFKRYSERIYYFSICYLKNKEEAEEVTQEVFVKLWNKRFELKPELSFSSYLFMIAKNKVIDVLRKRKKESEFNEELSSKIDLIGQGSIENIEYKELKEIVGNSIDKLPEKRKIIYLMSRNEGLTYKQIANKLNISVKTVESHMRLALQQLKQSIESKYELIILGTLLLNFFLESRFL